MFGFCYKEVVVHLHIFSWHGIWTQMWKQGSLLGSHCTTTAKETTRPLLQTSQGKFYSKLENEYHRYHKSLPCDFQSRLRAVYFYGDFSLVWLGTLCCQNTGIKQQKGHTRSEHISERYQTFHLWLESKTGACGCARMIWKSAVSDCDLLASLVCFSFLILFQLKMSMQNGFPLENVIWQNSDTAWWCVHLLKSKQTGLQAKESYGCLDLESRSIKDKLECSKLAWSRMHKIQPYKRNGNLWSFILNKAIFKGVENSLLKSLGFLPMIPEWMICNNLLCPSTLPWYWYDPFSRNASFELVFCKLTAICWYTDLQRNI